MTTCDNASRRTGYPIIRPQCWAGEATRSVTVRYDRYTWGSGGDEDEFALCISCASSLQRDCQRRGYRFKSRQL